MYHHHMKTICTHTSTQYDFIQEIQIIHFHLIHQIVLKSYFPDHINRLFAALLWFSTQTEVTAETSGHTSTDFNRVWKGKQRPEKNDNKDTFQILKEVYPAIMMNQFLVHLRQEGWEQGTNQVTTD